MALLSGLIRNVAITGRTDEVNAWFADRQGARWTERTIRGAFPNVAPRHRAPPAAAVQPRVDAAKRLEELTDLHERGVVTDAEFDRLRAGLHV